MKKISNKENQQSSSKDFIELNGEVTELLPAANFIVITESGNKVLAHLSGKMRLNNIKILVGDKVKLEMSPYDLTKGRIKYRL